MAKQHSQTIGITMGDPCGVGPEVTLKAVASLTKTSEPIDVVLIGSSKVLNKFIIVKEYFCYPPCVALMIKILSLLFSRKLFHSFFGTTALFTATAIPFVSPIVLESKYSKEFSPFRCCSLSFTKTFMVTNFTN